MDYIYSALFIIVLFALLVGLSKLDTRTKTKHKQAAYRLLEATQPDPKEINNSIKMLRLYGGRWRRDKECIQLVEKLQQKL